MYYLLILIFGVGNKHGLNYLNVQDSYGIDSGKGGENIDIKIFSHIVELVRVEKKSWDGENWV